MDEILTPEQWYELKGRIKKLYPELTETDLQYHEALEQDMLAMVEFNVQKIKKQMLEIISKQHHLFPLKYYWRSRRRNRISQSI